MPAALSLYYSSNVFLFYPYVTFTSAHRDYSTNVVTGKICENSQVVKPTSCQSKDCVMFLPIETQ